MRAVSNTWMVILGIVILIALIVALERHIRRSTTRSSMLSRQKRVAANDALRRRLGNKDIARVEKRKQELERTGGERRIEWAGAELKTRCTDASER
jgi:hypothetical protein